MASFNNQILWLLSVRHLWKMMFLPSDFQDYFTKEAGKELTKSSFAPHSCNDGFLGECKESSVQRGSCHNCLRELKQIRTVTLKMINTSWSANIIKIDWADLQTRNPCATTHSKQPESKSNKAEFTSAAATGIQMLTWGANNCSSSYITLPPSRWSAFIDYNHMQESILMGKTYHTGRDTSALHKTYKQTTNQTHTKQTKKTPPKKTQQTNMKH